MIFHSIGSRKARSRDSRPREQRGVVLFIALIVMVALSLAGIALIRSTDTAGIVAGNLAFKQASMAAVDRSVETAVHALWDGATPLVSDKTINNTGPAGQNYFACVQAVAGGCIPAGTPIPQIPDALDPKKFTIAYFTGKGLRASGLVTDDSGNNKSYYVVERMCLNAGLPVAPNCNLSSAAFGADPGTQHYFGLIRPGDAYYRITVRVEGPRNTVTYAQAILQ
jgi:type IV pilus assembly protein PilX